MIWAHAKKDKQSMECTAGKASESGIAVWVKHIRLRPLLFAACTLLFICIAGFASTAYGQNMCHLFVSWDNETMKIREDKNGWEMKPEYESDTKPAFDDAFFQKLEEFEMHPLLPSWMPEGFVLEKVESKIVTDYYRYALGIYTYGDKQFIISVNKDVAKNSGGVLSVVKDEREPDIFEQGGITFYIMDNLNRSHAIWFDLPYTVSIAGHVTRDELKQMINSMFDRE